MVSHATPPIATPVRKREPLPAALVGDDTEPTSKKSRASEASSAQQTQEGAGGQTNTVASTPATHEDDDPEQAENTAGDRKAGLCECVFCVCVHACVQECIHAHMHDLCITLMGLHPAGQLAPSCESPAHSLGQAEVQAPRSRSSSVGSGGVGERQQEWPGRPVLPCELFSGLSACMCVITQVCV